MASHQKLFLHDHPVSSYAQKVRIALREKGIEYDSATPKGLGSGQGYEAGFKAANPRLEVPALEDGDLKLFDSPIIIGYLEEKFPEKPLLPKDPAARANAKMIEQVCDTQYEAINWGMGEIGWFGRAEGELKQKLVAQAKHQTQQIQKWLAERLGSKDYFNGDSFGYADVAVAPYYNRSVHNSMGAPDGSPLQRWHARICERPAVKQTFDEMAAAAGRMSGLGEALKAGNFKREYRDHRLEWLVKSGGIDVVLDGLKNNNIRFSWPEPSHTAATERSAL